MKKVISQILKILLPLILGGVILWFVYRDFDFRKAGDVLVYDMNYGWMAVSLVFGVMSHVFRGWRWKIVLKHLGADPKMSNCVNAVFFSYLANLVLLRVGEISRCGILARYDGISFSRSLGTVVTERIIDTICILTVSAVTLLLQMKVFKHFFRETEADFNHLTGIFSSAGFYIILLSVLSAGILLFLLLRTLSFYERVKGTVRNIWEGIMSVRKVERPYRYFFYTLLIWFCYFMQFYISFYCFDFTRHLGVLAGLVLFVGGSFAVLVPTPNGVGPWHFAVITMMTLYGVSATDAGIFALIVHGIQTFLIILLGIYAMAMLPATNKIS
ncbi:MAG: flippase-like domain-containing protein [Bacteroides sp.]|nr:flippase-like domain-containing protein [Bacteroides sp.]